MKNFFQRKPDAPNPTRSNAAYKVWLPPEGSAPAPTTNWVPTSGRGPADASASTTYKYATGSYPYAGYPAPATAATHAYSAHYYPDRSDSRLGYVPYPYHTYVAPPPTASNHRRVAPTRAPEPAAGGDKAPRVPRRSSSSSIKGDAELKKSKHKTRDPGKRRGAETDVDKGKGPKRDRRSRLVAEEAGDSSDSSMQRPLSSAGHVRRRLDEGKMMRPQEPAASSARHGIPVASSSSSGKQTPQFPRMPVHLPAPGLSESDTDRGTLHTARQFLRRTTSKQRAPEPVVEKKAKESRGLWPFSRSKSTQPVLQGKVPAKTRADSTPSRYLPPTNDPSSRRPDTRRNASDSALSESSRQVPPPQDSLLRPDIQSSRGLFFTTQASDSSSRPITTAPQPTAPQPRASNNDPPQNPGIQPSKHPPPAAIPAPGYRSGPLPATSTVNGSSSGASGDTSQQAGRMAASQDPRPRATGSDNKLVPTTEPSFQPVTIASQSAALRGRSSKDDPPMPSSYRPGPVPTALPGLVDAPYQNDRPAVPQDSRSRATASDPRFQGTDTSSARPVVTASQQAALQALRSRSSSNANPSAQSLEQIPPTNTASRHGPFPVTNEPLVTTSGVVPPVMDRPYTPSRRDVQPNLPPIYAPISSAARAPDRSAPKVSQLVAGYEARSSEHIARPPARREPSVPQLHAPVEQPHRAPADNSSAAAKPHARREPSVSQLRQSSQNSGSTSANPAHRPMPVAYQYAGPPQLSKAYPPPTESSNNQAGLAPNQPDGLKTQLRDLLSDKASASRNDSKVQTRNLPPESRPNNVQPSAPPLPKPPDHLNPSAQPPVQVYSVVTASHKVKSSGETIPSPNPPATSSSRRPEIARHLESDRTSRPRVVDDRDLNRTRGGEVPSSNPPPASSSRRVEPTHHSESDRTSRVGRIVDDRDAVDRTPGRSSRSKKESVGVMKTPSKDSSRYTSSPSPVLNAQSTSQTRSSPQLASAPSSRHPDPPSMRSVPPNTTPSSVHRDRTSTKTHSSKTPPSPSPRPIVSASTHPFPSDRPAQPPSRSAGPAAATEPASLLFSQGHSAPRPRVPSQESILRTPSSLAHSIILPPSGSHNSLPASVSSENQKKGLFGMFRSKEQGQTSVPPPDRVPRPSGEDRRSKRWQAPQGERAAASDKPKHRSKGPPPPITIPNSATRTSDRKSPNATRVFTPFRYLSNKRRRVSTASMDAVDGTAPNTVLGSPTASMQSSQMQPTQSPPRRDVRMATQDWRNREESEAVARGGKLRRKRPGVVFDVEEDPLEESRARPARARKAQQPADTDSSDAS